jgi:hypothetical protein
MSFGENRIKEVKNGKEISKLVEDVEILVLNDGKEEETIDNEGQTIIEADIHEYKCRNFNLGSRPKQRVTRLRAKKEAMNHITCSRECKECEGMNPHTPK